MAHSFFASSIIVAALLENKQTSVRPASTAPCPHTHTPDFERLRGQRTLFFPSFLGVSGRTHAQSRNYAAPGWFVCFFFSLFFGRRCKREGPMRRATFGTLGCASMVSQRCLGHEVKAHPRRAQRAPIGRNRSLLVHPLSCLSCACFFLSLLYPFHYFLKHHETPAETGGERGRGHPRVFCLRISFRRLRAGESEILGRRINAPCASSFGAVLGFFVVVLFAVARVPPLSPSFLLILFNFNTRNCRRLQRSRCSLLDLPECT